MSQNKAPNQSKPIKNIEVGKFYFIHDGSKTGHPGYVVWKDDEKNRYLFIKFDSDKPGAVTKEEKGIKHITKLKHPISDDIINSYVKNRPFMCKRKDVWNKELTDLQIHPDDMSLINKISKNDPAYSSSFGKNKK